MRQQHSQWKADDPKRGSDRAARRQKIASARQQKKQHKAVRRRERQAREHAKVSRTVIVDAHGQPLSTKQVVAAVSK